MVPLNRPPQSSHPLCRVKSVRQSVTDGDTIYWRTGVTPYSIRTTTTIAYILDALAPQSTTDKSPQLNSNVQSVQLHYYDWLFNDIVVAAKRSSSLTEWLSRRAEKQKPQQEKTHDSVVFVSWNGTSYATRNGHNEFAYPPFLCTERIQLLIALLLLLQFHWLLLLLLLLLPFLLLPLLLLPLIYLFQLLNSAHVNHTKINWCRALQQRR